MKIELRNKEVGDSFFLEGQIDSDILAVADGQVSFPDKIDYNLMVNISQEMVVVGGNLKTSATYVCSRCLGDFTAEVENNKFDYCAKYTEGMCIDLTDALREAIIIRLLIKPLCDKDCKGLCTVCGSNLNEGGCGCIKEENKENIDKEEKKSAFDGLDFKNGKVDFN